MPRITLLPYRLQSVKAVRLWAGCLLALTAAVAGLGAAETSGAGEAAAPEQVTSFSLESPFQSGPTKVEVLLPKGVKAEAARRYPVVYILPVEPEGSFRFGSGFEEARKVDIASRLQVICVAPSFKVVPWYGNHATDPQIRQEDFVVKTLVPEIDRRLPTKADPEQRWLFGFSKSGWGALALQLRHPAVFGYAATWDSPFLLNGENHGKEWGPIGINKVYGTKEVFLSQLPTVLIRERAETLVKAGRARHLLGVGKDWRAHVEGMHALMEQLRVPHVYQPDLLLPHRWDSGWFVPLMDSLATMARRQPRRASDRD